MSDSFGLSGDAKAKLLARRKEVAVGSEDIAELSIYDKALLALYSRCGGEEKRLSAPGCWGLFNFFLDHFVGIDRLAPHEPASEGLDQYLEFQKSLKAGQFGPLSFPTQRLI